MRRGENGQATAEFALVLPLLLLALLGIFVVGSMLSDYLTVQAAAQQGANWAALGGTDQQVVQEVYAVASVLPANELTVTINPPQASRQYGENVTVTVSYPFSVNMPLLGVLLGNTVTLGSSATEQVG